MPIPLHFASFYREQEFSVGSNGFPNLASQLFVGDVVLVRDAKETSETSHFHCLTGKCCLIVRNDNTVLMAEKARIQVKTPCLSEDVEALYIPEAICDLVVGNVPGARNPDDSDMSVMVGCIDKQGHRQDRRLCGSR